MVFAAWKSGSRYSADAQKVADEITAIGEYATPKQILDKAKDAETELHKCFEWDNTKAGEKWRLHQARKLVCSLVFKEQSEQTDPAPGIRLFFKIDEDEGYKPVVMIMRDKAEYQKLLTKALSELRAFQAKYKSLTELDSIFSEIEKLVG